MELRNLKARALAEAADRATPSPHIHKLAARLGTETCDAICSRYEHGETADTLAAEHGVSRNAVLNLLRARAVTVRRAAPTHAQIAIATREYEAGKAIAPIAADLGLTYGALRRALMLAGVQMRPPAVSSPRDERRLGRGKPQALCTHGLCPAGSCAAPAIKPGVAPVKGDVLESHTWP